MGSILVVDRLDLAPDERRAGYSQIMIRPGDTSQDASRRQLEAIRMMTPSERLEIALAMSEEIRHIATAGILDRHPSFTEEEAAAALARLMLGAELADKVARARRVMTR